MNLYPEIVLIVVIRIGLAHNVVNLSCVQLLG